MSEKNINRPTILYVEDDDDTRPLIKQLLNKQGYRVIVDSSEEDALERAGDGRIAADLILVDLGKPPSDVLATGRRIRQAALVRDDVPVVVIAYKYKADMEGQDVDVGDNDWVTYLEDGEQLIRLLARLSPTYSPLSPPRLN